MPMAGNRRTGGEAGAHGPAAIVTGGGASGGNNLLEGRNACGGW